MKYIFCLCGVLMVLTIYAHGVDLPKALTDAIPDAAEELLEEIDVSTVDGFADGVRYLVEYISGEIGNTFRQRMKGAASVLLVVLLCGVIEGFSRSAEHQQPLFLTMAGALSVTILTVGSLDSLIGLGRETIQELNTFSNVLLPILAAAAAVSGSVATATLQQVTTVFLADVLMNLIDGLLMPMVYLYIGILTASACLPENRLGVIADGLKKCIVWILSTSLLLFTLYLSITRIIAGSVDSATIRVAKTTISGVVPVVGGIIAEASETVLAGAGLMKNTIGIFGMLVILAVCAYPFLQLGSQYLLYKLTAFLSGVAGAPQLCKLIDGLGGAFGLVLGMAGSCAILLLVSVLASVAAVVT